LASFEQGEQNVMRWTEELLRAYWLATIICLTVGVTSAAEPPLGDPNQPYDRFSTEIVTPHVAWANPSVTGPLNALVIAPCWQFRDTVELAQRLALHVTPLMVSSNISWYGAGESMSDLDGDLDELAKLRLSDGRHYQVVVIGKVLWTALPEWVRENVLRRVMQGTGLVYVSPAGEDEAFKAALATRDAAAESVLLESAPVSLMPLKMERQTSFPPMPAFGPFELQCCQFGQGRIAVLDYNDLDPKASPWTMHYWATPSRLAGGPWYDYYFAIVSRAMQWASRRELPVRTTPVLEQGATVSRIAALKGGVSFRIASPPELTGACTLRWRLRNEKDEQVFSKEAAARLPLGGEQGTALPVLPSGLHILDLWAFIDGKVAGWGSSAFRVESAGVLKDLKMTAPQFRKGEPVTGEVSLAAPLASDQALVVEVRDRLGRLVVQSSVKTQQNSGKFSLQIPEPIGCYFEATARVIDRTGPLEEKSVAFGIPNPRRDNFMLFQWGSPSEDPRTEYATREMQRVAGLTGYYDGVLYASDWDSVRPFAVAGARQGLQSVPYLSTYIMGPAQMDETPDGLATQKEGPWSARDLNNPAFLDRSRKDMEAYAKAYSGTDVVAYSINEEGGVPHGESCFCPFCLKAFSEYARKKYGTLEQANKVWGTQYRSWEEVRGGTLPDALKTGRCERWLDQRLFMVESYNRWQRAGIEGAKSVDPDCVIGAECVVNIDRSFDIPAMAQHWGTFGHDLDYMDAVKRSFMKKGDLSAFWSGNLPMEEDYHRYWPWHTLLQGMTHIFWYPGHESRGLGGIAALYPDFRPFACYLQTGEEVKEIRRGLGPLLIGGDMMLSPVAIHWSTLSYFLDIFHHPETRWENSLRDAFHALADSGFVYRYVGVPQIEAGALKDVKVLVLPYSQALTAKEAEAIRTWVREGGLLFADFLPGVFDANGTKLPKCQLADIFSDPQELKVNNFGKGHAVLTGSTLKGYTGRRATGDAGDRRGMTRMIEQYAGIKPWCRVEDSQGLDRGDTEITVFKNGETLFLGLLRDPGVRAEIAGAGGEWTVKRSEGSGGNLGTAESVVRLPKAFHVYDARRQDYLGLTDTIRTGLIKARAKVFALLPCKLTGIDLSLSSAKLKQGDLLKIIAKAQPLEAKSCGLGLRITITGPDGKEREEYARTLVMRNGAMETSIALALDEPTGTYTVESEEVISGLHRSVQYTVGPR